MAHLVWLSWRQGPCHVPQVLVSPDLAAIPRTEIHFDFDLERRLLAEGQLGTTAKPAQVYNAHQAHPMVPVQNVVFL